MPVHTTRQGALYGADEGEGSTPMTDRIPAVIAAAYAFPHHSAHSGYHRIAEFVDSTRVEIPPEIRARVGRFTPALARSILVRVTGLHGYFPECYWLERDVRRLVTASPGAIVHFFYPENSYYFSRTIPRDTARLVATYHQPPEEARKFIVKRDPLRRLDSVVLLSETQREFFEPIVGTDRIAVVPHGVDTTFFTPPERRPEGKQILAVGSWLRDFVTLAGTLRILEKHRPDVTCDVVATPRVRDLLAGMKNVRFHAGISDDALLKLYQSASIAIFPLTGAAANNALLEAMACGVPVVATDLPAIREYAQGDPAVVVPKDDPAAFADVIDTLVNDTGRLRKMSGAARRQAERYAWEIIGKDMSEVYRRVAGEGKGST